MAAPPIVDDGLYEECARWETSNPIAKILAVQYSVRYEPNGNRVVDYWLTGDTWSWAGFGKQPGMLGVLPAGIDRGYADASAHPRYREGKAGRIARQLLTPAGAARVTDADVEDFANRVKATMLVDEATGRWDLLRGGEIAHAYAYAETTIDSCMVHEPEEWFALYAENPRVCALLTRWDLDDELVGRALVWTTADGATVMDRVYGNDPIRTAFAAYADREGWYRRVSSAEFYPPGERAYRPRDFTVKLGQCRFAHYPYLDTFYTLDLDRSCLRNGWDRTFYVLTNTDGSPDLMASCANCGCDLDEDDAETGDNGRTYCGECIAGHQCPHCGEWTGNGSYCDPCREQHVCADCDAYDDGGLAMTDGGDAGYCDRCVADHTCASCDAVCEELAGGRCDDCTAKCCPVCGGETSDLLTIRGRRTTSYDARAVWSQKRRCYVETRVTCHACEEHRVTAIVARLRGIRIAQQEAAGQVRLPLPA